MGKLPRHIIFACVIVIQICLTLVSTLGGLSSVLILNPNEQNIQITNFNFDAPLPPDPVTFNFTLILNNTGVYDFQDLEIDFDLNSKNVSGEYDVLDGEYSAETIAAGEKLDDVVEFTGSDFSFPPGYNFTATYTYSLNISISFRYSLNLIGFQIDLHFDESDMGSFGGGA